MTDLLNRILYVEDELDIQTIARMSLETIGGFVVRVCSSGLEATKAAADFAPDLILLDAMMPGMDGESTMKELRRLPKTAKVPVVMFTAKARPQEVSRYKNLGASEVIPKPFDPLTLPQQLRDIWEKCRAKPQ